MISTTTTSAFTATETEKNGNNNFLSKYQVPLPSTIADLGFQFDSNNRFKNISNRTNQKGKKTKNAQMPVATLRPNDIVCGRGKRSHDRIANKQFQECVYDNIGKYLAAKTKMDKSIVLNHIIETIYTNANRQEPESPVRFVRQDKSSGDWVELSYDEVRDKVGHFMRNAIGSIKDKNVWKRTHFEDKQSSLLDEQKRIFQTMILHEKRKQ